MEHEFFPETLTRRYGAGEYIFHEGDPGRHMYVVRSGSVEFRQKNAEGESVVLRRIGVGQLFGEIALIEDVPRTADAIALEDGTELVEIDHAHFVYLVGQQPAFAIMVMQMLSQRLRDGERDWQQRPAVGGASGASTRPSEWKRLRENVYYLMGEPGGGGCKVYLVRGTRRNVLIDAGLPYDFPYLKAHLETLGLAPEQIDMVLLTHEHMDHVGSAPRFPARTVIAAHPRAANKIGLLDDFVMGSDVYDLSPASFHIDFHIPDDTLIDLGDCALRTIHTPGHVSGAVCFYEPEQRLMFTADTIFASGILGGIFASGSGSDYNASLRRLLSLRIDEIFPGHGRNSTQPHEDIERGIRTTETLARETRALFDSMSHGNSFSYIFRGTAAYASRGVAKGGAGGKPKAEKGA
ncbi:MAG: MBL fold metallo-hydrolase [Burkholderiales bacterium]|nr:MAG: MBL fold metallo-hydrolase [Burkholderiales bacterium]